LNLEVHEIDRFHNFSSAVLQGHDLSHTFNAFIGLPWPALLFMGLGTTALTL